MIFGDGAGAVIIEHTESSEVGVLGVDLGADGPAGSTMVIPTLGTRGELSTYRDPAVHRPGSRGDL